MTYQWNNVYFCFADIPLKIIEQVLICHLVDQVQLLLETPHLFLIKIGFMNKMLKIFIKLAFYFKTLTYF